MKDLKYIIIILLLFGFKSVTAQDSLFHRSVFFQFDNDLLFFDAGDRYYTNGLFVGYRQQTKEESSLNNPMGFESLVKSIWEVSLVSKIYNPYDLRADEADQIDRPYAGLIYSSIQYRSVWESFVWTLGTDLGWLGPKTGIDDIQYNLHRSIGWVHPRGWKEFQINDTPILQVHTSLHKEWLNFSFLSFSSKFGGTFGSVDNHLLLNSSIRLGRCLDLGSSVLSDAALGRSTNVQHKNLEIFFVYTPQVKRVFYNATIEGNLIGSPTDFVKESHDWVSMHSLGFMISSMRVDFQALWTFLSPEVVGGRKHKYGTLVLTRRF